MDPAEITFRTATHPAIWLGLAFFFGASVGSFVGVLAERLPVGDSPNGRSHCICGRQLPVWENLPAVSWLLLRGRASCCGATIPAWYFALEVAFGTVGLTFASLWVTASAPPIPLAVSAVAVWVAAAVGAVRYRQSRLPADSN